MISKFGMLPPSQPASYPGSREASLLQKEIVSILSKHAKHKVTADFQLQQA
jgi:hypothetical protein